MSLLQQEDPFELKRGIQTRAIMQLLAQAATR